MAWRARKWVSRALSRHAGVRRTDGRTNDKEGMFAAQGGAAEGRCGRSWVESKDYIRAEAAVGR